MSNGHNKRAGESGGRRLSPGERAGHWASAAVTLWPVIVGLVGLLGYTNQETIKGWTGLAEPDGVTEIDTTADFEAQVQKFSQETVTSLEQLKADVGAIRSQMSREDKRNFEALEDADEALQDQIDEIKELVN